MNPAAITTSPLAEQFQALQQMQASGQWAALEQGCQELLDKGLKAHQSALVLQLQAEAALADGGYSRAAELLDISLQRLFLPQSALQWLELVLPEWIWKEASSDPTIQSPNWLPVCKQLVSQGYAELLLRCLAGVIAQLPLEGQRIELVEAFEYWEAVPLNNNPELQRQWSWLKRAAPAGGAGLWA